MIVGCYCMDLYCDSKVAHAWRGGQAQFTGPTASNCNKQARQAGWKLDLTDNTCYCPKCEVPPKKKE